MKPMGKQISMQSTNPKMGGTAKVKGYKDGGYVMKPDDYVAVEDKQAAVNKARDAQIKADAEAMKKKYPEKKGK